MSLVVIISRQYILPCEGELLMPCTLCGGKTTTSPGATAIVSPSQNASPSPAAVQKMSDINVESIPSKRVPACHQSNVLSHVSCIEHMTDFKYLGRCPMCSMSNVSTLWIILKPALMPLGINSQEFPVGHVLICARSMRSNMFQVCGLLLHKATADC